MRLRYIGVFDECSIRIALICVFQCKSKKIRHKFTPNFLIIKSPCISMNAKINMRQYIIFTQPRNFDTADIKHFVFYHLKILRLYGIQNLASYVYLTCLHPASYVYLTCLHPLNIKR